MDRRLEQYRTTHVVQPRPFRSRERVLRPHERSHVALVILGLLVVMLAATCSACFTNAMLPKPIVRTAREQHVATVMFMKTCLVPQVDHLPPSGDDELDVILNNLLFPPEEHVFAGSGVLVSKNRALTNVHVATCEAGKLSKLVVNAGEGQPWFSATAEILLPEYDIARVRISSDALEPYFTPVEIGPKPDIGAHICMSSAMPDWSYRCGEVQPSTPGHLPTSILVLHGNSGSGAFVDGKLVGLVRATQYCEGGVPCVGWVTPLQGWGFLIP